MRKIKILNIILVLTALLTYMVIYIYWEMYCKAGSCDYNMRNEFLRPISIGSIYLALIAIPFLFLKADYFKKWLKYIFSWGFPLTVYLTYITTGSSSIPAYGKVDVVKFWGIVFAVITIVFVAFKYYRSRNKK